EAAPLLEQAGFGLIAPSWWGRPAARLGIKARARAAAREDRGKAGLLGMDGIVDVDWILALGDERISLDELKRLAALKVPLVQVRGQWVEVRREDIDKALAFLEKGAPTGMSIPEIMRLGLGAEPSPAGLPFVGVEAEGELGDLVRGEMDIEPCSTPEGFGGKLRPYQERGLSWLAFLGRTGLGACLADDMGLGKTVQLLALLVDERNKVRGGMLPGPTLLVCPMSVIGNWQAETARFAPCLRVITHHGTERAQGEDFADAALGADLVLTTYALTARDKGTLARVSWHRVVLDEAQNIKNPAAQQARAVRELEAKRRVAMTGTPVENRLSELWSIMQFLNPGLLGSQADFRTRFGVPVERYRDKDKAEILRRLTGPFVLRRLKTDRTIISDLPEKIEVKERCLLTREQATLYQAVLDDMMKRIAKTSGIERKGLVLTTMLRLKQVCNHPAHLLGDRSALDGRSGKLARLEELLLEIADAGDRALVFTQFTEMGSMLKPHLEEKLGVEVLFLHGGTPRKARDAMVAGFQAGGGPAAFLLSLKAGGTGLNLTAANHVIHFDRWWNPAVEAQATDRAFRIGQKRGVQVRKLVCAGTLEERIDKMIEDKKELAQMVVGAGEAWITELSTAALREVFALSADAVADG
ncbi:MAG: DEAD/DEAH box helicase, partial [Deltaproteobacteria bacterium]|nr:DEAD/DEAH box helicase [Deltaproteobacteria bacterium]